MTELEKLNLLQAVDIISSVSGGSLTAAYYATSCRTDDTTCPANENSTAPPTWSGNIVDDAIKRMNKNFYARWFKGLNPFYSFKYWFNTPFYWDSSFNRSSLMAHLFAAHLFPIDDNKVAPPHGEEWDLLFKHLNAARPNLIINATDYTTTSCRKDLGFSFTSQEFRYRKSSLAEFPISLAVMASAAYLGLFPYVTVRDYRSVSEQESANHTCDNPLRVAIEEIDQSTNDSENPKKFSYIHLFVGGSFDNFGLNSVRRILQNMTGKLKPKKFSF